MNNAQSVLKTVFGFNEFRPGQREVISAVLSGRNTLAVMPTGGGKHCATKSQPYSIQG